MTIDILIVGAGPVGIVAAERLANLGFECLLIDKRNHLAGNCYDTKSKYNVLYHKYGPHYFRTNDIKLLNYLKRFSKFHNADYYVKSYLNKNYFDFPINLNTLSKFFNIELNPKSAQKLLKTISLNIKNPKNFEEYLLNTIGRDLYDSFFKNYTLKQWDIDPRQLPISVAERIPLRMNYDKRYVNEKYQLMPSQGFTNMFTNMTHHKNIKIELNTDYFKIRDKIKPKLFTLYTGPIDKFFNYKYGKLNWRSLKFKFLDIDGNFGQKHLQINYPNNFKFTRSVEVKHITHQKSKYSLISREYPKSEGDPYYPVNSPKDKVLYLKYLKLVKNVKNIYFKGRLAEYTYINTDQAIQKALDFVSSIKNAYK